MDWALQRLEADLLPNLHYHNFFHTSQDVIPAARQLAEDMELSDELVDLIVIAAAFHDIGFTQQYEDHEEAGVLIADRALPNFGVSAAQLELVRGMIRATKLPQSPNTVCEQILADADLDVLGRPDFLARNRCLRDEMALLGQVSGELAWFSTQLEFIDNHNYFTARARLRRDHGKRLNRASLLALWQTAQP
jgi:uncharacterized protein